EGSYPITVTISDSNGDSDPLCEDGANGTGAVRIVDAHPTISGENIHACEGGVAVNSGSFSDYDDVVSVSLLSGPGSVTQSGTGVGLPGTWHWSSGSGLAVGSYTVVLRATNADGSTADTAFTVDVGNATPTVTSITITSTGPYFAGITPVAISAAWVDPGST